VWLRLDRVVDDGAEIDDGDLENHHQEDQLHEGVRATHDFEFTRFVRRKLIALPNGVPGHSEDMSHDQLRALMEHGEEAGCINLSAFTQLLTELEIDDEETQSLYQQLEDHGIELTDDCSLPDPEETHYSNETVAAMTTDSLQLFLNEAGRY
jgi:hypothetical protein